MLDLVCVPEEDPNIINSRVFKEWYDWDGELTQGEHTPDGLQDGRIIFINHEGLHIQRFR